MIIGFGHQRNVGKDTAAKIMSTELKFKRTDLEVLNIGFADPIYEICYKLYGWAGMQSKAFYEDHREEKEAVLPKIGLSPRDLLIRMGTPAIRENVYEDTWVDYAMHQRADVIFISDVRFPNEAQAIKDSGGILIKINRGLSHVTDLSDPDNQLLDWVDWDHIMDNQGTLSEFANACRSVLGELQCDKL